MRGGGRTRRRRRRRYKLHVHVREGASEDEGILENLARVRVLTNHHIYQVAIILLLCYAPLYLRDLVVNLFTME